MTDYVPLVERQVAQQLERGARFEDVEMYIDALALSDDYKSALWLLAWSELPHYQRRRMIFDQAGAACWDTRARRRDAQEREVR